MRGSHEHFVCRFTSNQCFARRPQSTGSFACPLVFAFSPAPLAVLARPSAYFMSVLMFRSLAASHFPCVTAADTVCTPAERWRHGEYTCLQYFMVFFVVFFLFTVRTQEGTHIRLGQYNFYRLQSHNNPACVFHAEVSCRVCFV